MRLFAGFPIPEPAQSELGELPKVLQQDRWRVHWVRPEELHLTIKFFGTVAESDVPLIETVLQNAAEGFGPVPLTLLADRLVLFESAQARNGSVYTPRQVIELSSCPAA